MPPPLRNPNWAPGNGQPEWIQYDPPNPNYGGRSQLGQRQSSRAAQPHQVSSTGMVPGSEAPSDSAFAQSLRVELPSGLPHGPFGDLPTSTLAQPSTSSPADPSANASYYGVTSNAGISDGAGTPFNHGTMPRNSTMIYPDTAQDGTGNLDHHVPDPVGNNDFGAHDPGSESGNNDPSLNARILQVKRLLRVPGTDYGRHIGSFEEHEQFKEAYKQSFREDRDDRSGDMPQDPAGLQRLVERLVLAIANLVNIESSLTRNQYNKNKKETEVVDSVAVKCVKEMGQFRLEMLAWDFMVSLPATDHYFV